MHSSAMRAALGTNSASGVCEEPNRRRIKDPRKSSRASAASSGKVIMDATPMQVPSRAQLRISFYFQAIASIAHLRCPVRRIATRAMPHRARSLVHRVKSRELIIGRSARELMGSLQHRSLTAWLQTAPRARRQAMPVYARIIMVLVAALLGWTMLRAARSGTVVDDGRSYVEGDQPSLFVFIMIARFFCILF